MNEERDRVCQLAAEVRLNDNEFIGVYSQVREALHAAFGPVDSGMGAGWADYWITVGDVEYKLVLKPHRNLAKSQ